MPDKMNLDYLKLIYCGCQKYEVMTMSVIGGPPKTHSNPSWKASQKIGRAFLVSDYYQLKVNDSSEKAEMALWTTPSFVSISVLNSLRRWTKKKNHFV